MFIQEERKNALSRIFDLGQLLCFQRKVDTRPLFRIFNDELEMDDDFQFMVINPFLPGSTTRNRKAIERIQSIILEMDGCSRNLQIKWVESILGKPTVQVWSGGKSVHNIYRFNEPLNKEQFDNLTSRIINCFPWCDHAVLNNPNGLCRTPGAVRINGNKQEIISLNNRVNYQEMISSLESYEKTLTPSILKIHQIIKYDEFAKYMHLYSNREEVLSGFEKRIQIQKDLDIKEVIVVLCPLKTYISKLYEDGYINNKDDKNNFFIQALKENPIISECLDELLVDFRPNPSREIFVESVKIKESDSTKYQDNKEIQEAVLNTLLKCPGLFDNFQDFKRILLSLKSVGLPYDGIVDQILHLSSGYDYAENKKMYEKANPNSLNFGTAYWYAKYAAPDMLKDELSRIAKERIQNQKGQQAQQNNQNTQGNEDEQNNTNTRTRRARARQLTEQDYAQWFRANNWAFRTNDITDEIQWKKDGKWIVLKEAQRARMRLNLDDWGILNHVKTSSVKMFDLVQVEAEETIHHPVKEYLNNLPAWDGTDYIKQAAESFDDPLANRYFQVFFANSVKRIMEGGSQVICLVLSSHGQGAGKSTFSQWACPKSLSKDFYLKSSIKPEDKDCRLRLINSWIWEIEELGATTRKADIDALKHFITLDKVRDRKPYGRDDTIKPTMASFIGTVNDAGGFLVDQTGNRRFMCVNAQGMKHEYSAIDIDKVWAQAIALYKEGKFELSMEERIIQEEKNDENLIQTPTDIYLEKNYISTGSNNDFVSTAEIINDLKESGIQLSRMLTVDISAYFGKIGIYRARYQNIRGYFGIRKINRELASPVDLMLDKKARENNRAKKLGVIKPEQIKQQNKEIEDIKNLEIEDTI